MLSAAVFAMKKRARKCHKALGGTFEGRRVWVKLSVSGQCPSATKELKFGIKFKFVFHTLTFLGGPSSDTLTFSHACDF